MTLLAASVYPSNCGWNAEVMWSLMPMRRMSTRQNAEVKMGSTTVKMTNLPPTRGSASMKSSRTSAQTAVGTGSSSRRPAGCRCSDLYLWQVMQAGT